MNLQRFFRHTLKKYGIRSFSLGFKEDWQPEFTWMIQDDIQGNRHEFYYDNAMTVVLEVERSLTKEEQAYFQDLFEIISIQEKLSSKEYEIQKLQEGLQAIVTNVQVESLLENILQNAVDAIPAATTGILTLYNEKTNMLENIATVGLNKELRSAKFEIGEAIVGKIFVEGKSKLFTNRTDIASYFENVTSKNLAIVESEEKLFQSSGVIAVPIKLSDKTVGVILLHQQENQFTFSEFDVKTIEHFASQMALAILNARTYYQLQERKNYLSIRNQIQERLITLSLSNKGVPAIINEIKSILEMNLLYYDYIYDKDYQTISHQKDAAFFEEVRITLDDNVEAKYVNIQDEKFYVQPVIIDHTIVAVLVADTSKDISETEGMLLEQSAVMLSLEMMKKQSMMDRYLKHNQELFHQITSVSSREASELLNREINYQSNQSYCMIVVQIAKVKQSISSEFELHQLIFALEKQLEYFDIFLFGMNHQITMFVTYDDQSAYQSIKNEMTAFLNNFSTFSRVSIYAGISTEHHDLTYLNRLTDEAKKACEYAVRHQSKQFITFDGLGINTLFITQSQEYIESFVHDIFGPLSQEKNDLTRTLRTYVACNASPKKTADKLFIHINTLYQRLNKIENMLNVSFNNQEDYLKIQLACYLYDNYIS